MSDHHVIQKPLSELDFSDLQVRLDNRGMVLFQGRAKGTTQAPLHPLPEEFAEAVTNLKEELRMRPLAAGSILVDGIQYRYQKMTGQNDSVFCVVRRLENREMRLHDLQIAPDAMSTILNWANMQSGLILIAGATGQGKTTLGKHLFKEFMITNGGRGISIEDPIEYLMQGKMGDRGFCIQHEDNSGDWSTAIQACLRMRPSYLYIGELRTPRAALEALKASATGHIVITTTHAGSMDEAIGRMAQLTSGAPDSGGMDYVRGELGKSLIGIIVSKLSNYGPDLTILHGSTEAERADIARLIEEGHDQALAKSGNLSWSKHHIAPRPPRGAGNQRA